MPAGGPHTVVATASSGATQTLTDILFGDVYLCGGQSNMAFASTHPSKPRSLVMSIVMRGSFLLTDCL